MLNLAKLIKPWTEAASLNAHINLYGFWNETTFLTKTGDLGMVLAVPGVDYESLDNAEQQYAVRRLESALKTFSGEGFHVYQYLFKTNRPDIPFAHYGDELIDAAIDQRRQFFETKRDRLYQIEIFYVVILEGPHSKPGFFRSLGRLVTDPKSGYADLKAQFASDQMKLLLRTQIDTVRVKLEQRIEQFIRQTADLMPITVLHRDEQFTFLRRLVNFDAWRIAGLPHASQYLDYQIVNSDIEAEREYLRVGDHYVRTLTMKEAIVETRPLVLDQLLKIEANFYVVTEWTPLTTGRARKEVEKRRKHFNMAKSGFISQLRDPTQTSARDQLIDESKQADVENLGDCMRALGEGQLLGDFSLTVVLYAPQLETIERSIGEFAGIFTNRDGALFTETYNQLNAFFAVVPGNTAHNLRKMYHLLSNYADLSFLFTIHPGEKTNPQLSSEYLAVLETDNATPYFLNLHNGEVAHTLILGMTGSGKSFLCNFLLTNTQKYKPLTFIFDIGGSFQSLTEIFGGTYLNVGQESRDFKINPFSLPQSKENTQFLYAFFKVLIEGNEQHYRLDFKEERKLYEAIERMYMVAPDQRTLSTFTQIIGELKDRLHRWTNDGQYGFLFDNVEDTLSFARFQTFNFAGWGDAPEVLEPLLFYVLHRASNEIADPAKLATFKTFLLDEAWLFIRNETIRDYVVQAQKTWRKHNAAMILATQSIKELEESGMLAIVAESCPTKIFLANPEMNRDVYREAFHLNDTELNIIADLLPPGEMLVRKAKSSKKVRLNVDSVSYWIATNNAKDNLLKREAFRQHGIAEGVKQLALTHPFQTRR